MARPKKQKELKRNHHIMLRLNDTDYDIVTENAQTANLSVADYARKQVKKLISEFGKIGSNLNQIAKYFNQGGIHSQEMRAAINQCITELYEMKYKVTKMAGNFHGDTETHSE